MSGGELRLGPADSLLVFAAHPDDETLAAGGLLQRAQAAGMPIRVAFVTDGENNPWPQRVLERRWRIDEDDRRRFGALRRAEARRALGQLGLDAASIGSLGLPDQGLTSLVVTDPEPACAAIRAELSRTRPTVVVAPSPRDCHPDHSAFAVLLELARRTGETDDAGGAGFRLLHYRVHGRSMAPPTSPGPAIRLSADEQERKHRAILEYRSQLVFRSRFFRSFASADEAFEAPSTPCREDRSHPIRVATDDGDEIRLSIRSRSLIWSSQPKTLLVAGLDEERRPIGVSVPAVEGELRLPRLLVGAAGCLFAKLEHRWSFFDEDGWREIELATAPAVSASASESAIGLTRAAAP